MSDWPQSETTPLFVDSFSIFAREALAMDSLAPTGASATWYSAGAALYIPFWLPWPYLVSRVFWGNGSSVGINIDFGIYNRDGVRIYSTGLTNSSGASVLQYVSPATPFVLSPGPYYMGLAIASTTNRTWAKASATAINMRLGGVLGQAIGTLPANWTPAAATNTVVPLCGITRTASGF